MAFAADVDVGDGSAEVRGERERSESLRSSMILTVITERPFVNAEELVWGFPDRVIGVFEDGCLEGWSSGVVQVDFGKWIEVTRK
jgi:hypothetical protein